MFSDKEIAYLNSQRLARIATASEGQPDVAPVGLTFDGRHFFIGGLDKRTLKYKNAKTNERVALVIRRPSKRRALDTACDQDTWQGSYRGARRSL